MRIKLNIDIYTMDSETFVSISDTASRVKLASEVNPGEASKRLCEYLRSCCESQKQWHERNVEDNSDIGKE